MDVLANLDGPSSGQLGAHKSMTAPCNTQYAMRIFYCEENHMINDVLLFWRLIHNIGGTEVILEPNQKKKTSSVHHFCICGLIAGNGSLISFLYVSVGFSSHQWCLS